MVTVVAGLWLLQHQLLQSIDRSKCRRWGAEVRSVASAIEEYKTEFGHYPRTMTNRGLADAITPRFLRALPPELDYFSDGASYAIFHRWGLDGPVMNTCMFEYRDGEFVSWPADIGWN